MNTQKQIPTLRQLCDEFTARHLEHDLHQGKILIQSAVKEGNELVVELIGNSTADDEQAYYGRPMAETLRLECSQMSKERLLKQFNQKTIEPEVCFDPHHPSAKEPIFSHKRRIYSCHGVTGTYKGSNQLGYVEHARNPDGTIDKRSLRLRFLPDENGDSKKPVFVNYTTPRLAAEALDDLKETAKKNRQAQTGQQPHTAEKPEPRLVAGLHRILAQS